MVALTTKERERFNAKVDRSGGPDACWPWTGAKHVFGYGRLTIRSRVTGAWTQETAHRIALWQETGSPPSDFVLHSCDNPCCCNPAHLREGTAKDNAQDAVQRGRQPGPPPRYGEDNQATKLTEQSVQAIRTLATQGFTHKALGRIFGIHHKTVGRIVNRQTWAHVT